MHLRMLVNSQERVPVHNAVLNQYRNALCTTLTLIHRHSHSLFHISPWLGFLMPVSTDTAMMSAFQEILCLLVVIFTMRKSQED